MAARPLQVDKSDLGGALVMAQVWATAVGLELSRITAQMTGLAHRTLDVANGQPAPRPECVAGVAIELDEMADRLKALLRGSALDRQLVQDLSADERAALLATRLVLAPDGLARTPHDQLIIPEALEELAERLRTEPPRAVLLAWFAGLLERLAADLRLQDHQRPRSRC
jgi:hypothetical protein